jgi:hypothetical protein
MAFDRHYTTDDLLSRPGERKANGRKTGPDGPVHGHDFGSEADTYHRGNDRRVLGRSADMLTALRKSGDNVVKRFLKAFDDGAATVPYDRSSKSRTEEKQRMDAHRAGQKALADSLDRIGESRRKKGAK